MPAVDDDTLLLLSKVADEVQGHDYGLGTTTEWNKLKNLIVDIMKWRPGILIPRLNNHITCTTKRRELMDLGFEDSNWNKRRHDTIKGFADFIQKIPYDDIVTCKENLKDKLGEGQTLAQLVVNNDEVKKITKHIKKMQGQFHNNWHKLRLLVDIIGRKIDDSNNDDALAGGINGDIDESEIGTVTESETGNQAHNNNAPVDENSANQNEGAGETGERGGGQAQDNTEVPHQDQVQDNTQYIDEAVDDDDKEEVVEENDHDDDEEDEGAGNLTDREDNTLWRKFCRVVVGDNTLLRAVIELIHEGNIRGGDGSDTIDKLLEKFNGVSKLGFSRDKLQEYVLIFGDMMGYLEETEHWENKAGIAEMHLEELRKQFHEPAASEEKEQSLSSDSVSNDEDDESRVLLNECLSADEFSTRLSQQRKYSSGYSSSGEDLLPNLKALQELRLQDDDDSSSESSVLLARRLRKNSTGMAADNLQQRLKKCNAELIKAKDFGRKAEKFIEKVVWEKRASDEEDSRQKLANETARFKQLEEELDERLKQLEERKKRHKNALQLRALVGNSNSTSHISTNSLHDLDWVQEEISSDIEEVKKEQKKLQIKKRPHQLALFVVDFEKNKSKYKPGQKLGKRYSLLKLLGKGGFAEVWQAFDLSDMQYVAVKIQQVDSIPDEKRDHVIEHINRECLIHSDVRHRHVVSHLSSFQIDEGFPVFVTVLECCDGPHLGDKLNSLGGSFPERHARAILIQIMRGMQYLSSKNIIHCDFKPSNVLFDAEGIVKITDFGISKTTDYAGEIIEQTSPGMGTFWYLPREYVNPGEKISNKVDVWSIGVTYFMMLFGKLPWGGNHTQNHLFLHKPILELTDNDITIPDHPPTTDGAKDFIRKCLKVYQKDRPDMAELCQHPYLSLSWEDPL